MRAFDDVGLGRGEGGGGQGCGNGDGNKFFHDFSWVVGGMRLFFGGCCMGYDMELDLDFVGDGADICPRAFTDRVIQALQDEGSVKYAGSAFLPEGKGRRYVQGFSFEG